MEEINSSYECVVSRLGARCRATCRPPIIKNGEMIHASRPFVAEVMMQSSTDADRNRQPPFRQVIL